MMFQLLYILGYGLTMAGLGLYLGYRWGKFDGIKQEWERHERLRKLNNKKYGEAK